MLCSTWSVGVASSCCPGPAAVGHFAGRSFVNVLSIFVGKAERRKARK